MKRPEFATCLLPGCIYVAILILAGCAATPRNDEVVKSEIQFEIVETLPTSTPLIGRDLYSLEPGQWVHQTGGESTPEEQVIFIGEDVSIHDSTYALAKGEIRIEYRMLDDLGRIVMPATLENDENALTRFDPPLIIAYGELSGGEMRETESAMRVLDSRRPKRQLESGKAKRTIEYVSDQHIRTPLGDFSAKRVEVHFIADLRFAYADKTAVYWVVPDLGVVAQEHVEEIRILGIVSERSRQVLVMIETPVED